MFIVGLLSWWYSSGWVSEARRVRERIASAADYFSIGLLAKTLFSPFRQISAGRVDGPIGVKWRAFVDRLISRCIGALVRTFMIVIGIIWIATVAIIGVIALGLWLLVPAFPVIGIIMMIVGWVPSWR